jgi:large subunit ribosomal protein L22|tara:strand:- start:29774 stop:30175 length:402 start_codon:yes stop_codon:yes gene_type:complete
MKNALVENSTMDNDQDVLLTISQATAIAKRIRMSPNKVRRVLKLINGCSYQDALILLEFLPYKACGVIWQVLRSAVSNAENTFNVNKQDLRIKEIFVTQGPTMKRFRPRAQGRAFVIRKPLCHLTVVIEVTPN